MTWESPFSPCTNDLKFPFPYAGPLTRDFPPLRRRPVIPCPPETLLLFQQPLQTQRGGKKNPTPSCQLLQADISHGKMWPHISQWFMELA